MRREAQEEWLRFGQAGHGQWSVTGNYVTLAIAEGVRCVKLHPVLHIAS